MQWGCLRMLTKIPFPQVPTKLMVETFLRTSNTVSSFRFFLYLLTKLTIYDHPRLCGHISISIHICADTQNGRNIWAPVQPVCLKKLPHNAF